ncbi:MAG: acetate/propionate family kinase [Reyranellaceae bacterium]
MADSILVVNAGSSSIKFQLFDVGAGNQPLRGLRGQLDGIGTQPRLRARDGQGVELVDRRLPADAAADVVQGQAMLASWLVEQIGALPVAVGHRVVHGGAFYAEPVLIDEEVLERLQTLAPLAPLHQPANLGPIRAIRANHPRLPQVACFDTAFHRGHPELADRFAIPDALYREGVRRYGFHGLSYEYIASRLAREHPALAGGKVVVAHLGSGCSMCALDGGRSIESTMGFTALDGLPMGTRPGQLDAGVILYLIDGKGMDSRQIQHFLYHECGLKGLSGISNDVRELLASDDARARLALDYFVYRIAMAAGSLAAALGGIDGLVFTAGVGENAPVIRKRVAERLAWLGLKLDDAANDANAERLSAPDSAIQALALPTDEELMIARHTLDLIRRPARQA